MAAFLLLTTWLVPGAFFLGISGDYTTLPGVSERALPLGTERGEQQQQQRGMGSRLRDALRWWLPVGRPLSGLPLRVRPSILPAPHPSPQAGGHAYTSPAAPQRTPGSSGGPPTGERQRRGFALRIFDAARRARDAVLPRVEKESGLSFKEKL